MAWELTGKPVTKRITHALATEFRDMDAPPNDRDLSERRLQIYQRIAIAHGFRPVAWAKAFCKATNQLYRVNGKHTSTLFSGLDPLPELYAVIEEFTCDTLEDVARLYCTYDSKLQSRTANDVYHAFAASVPELANLPRRLISAVASGMAYARWHDAYTGMQAADRAELMLDEPAFALFLNELLPNSSARHLMRVPVVGAVYCTWKKAAAKALEFWTAVREETGATPTCPDRRIARWLITNSVNTGKGAEMGKPSSRRAAPREFFVKCIHAWNAWRKGDTTDLKYFKDAKIPAVA